MNESTDTTWYRRAAPSSVAMTNGIFLKQICDHVTSLPRISQTPSYSRNRSKHPDPYCKFPRRLRSWFVSLCRSWTSCPGPINTVSSPPSILILLQFLWEVPESGLTVSSLCSWILRFAPKIFSPVSPASCTVNSLRRWQSVSLLTRAAQCQACYIIAVTLWLLK